MSNDRSVQLSVDAAVEGLHEISALVEEIEELGASAEDARQSIESTEERVQALAEELREVRALTREQLGNPTEELEKGVRDTGKAVDGLSDKFRSLASAMAPTLGDMQAEMAKARGTVGKFRSVLRSLPKTVKIDVLITGAVESVRNIYNLGDALWRAYNAQQNLKEIQENSKKYGENLLQEGQKLTEQYKKYADTVLLSKQEVDNLSETERKAYEERLNGLEKYLQGQSRVAVAQGHLGKNTILQQDSIKRRYDSLREAQAAFAAETEETAQSAKQNLGLLAQELTDQFDKLVKDGKSVSGAFSGISEMIDPRNLYQVRSLVEVYGELKERGEEAGRENEELGKTIENALIKRLQRLSGKELQQFQRSVENEFGTASEHAEALGEVLGASLDAASKNLGLDLERFRSGMTTAGKQAIEQFKAVASNSEASAEQIQAAFRAAAEQIQTEKGVDSLRDAVQESIEQNKIAAKATERILGGVITKTERAAKEAAEKSKQALNDALSGLDAAETKESIISVRRELNELYRNGEIGPEQLSRGMEAVKLRLDEIQHAAGEAIDSVADFDSALAVTDSVEGLEALKRRLHEAWKAGRINAEAYNKALKQIQRKQQAVGEESKETGEKVSEGMDKAADAGNRASDGMDRAADATDRVAASAENTGTAYGRLSEHAREALQAALELSRRGSFTARGDFEARLDAQRESYRGLKETIDSAGDSLADMARLSNISLSGLHYIAEQDLQPLRSAIESAKSRMRQFREQTESTVDSIDAELYRLQGNYVELEKQKLAARRRDIAAQLEKAKRIAEADGSNVGVTGGASSEQVRQLQKALKKLDEIEEIRLERAEKRMQEETERRQQETQRRREEKNDGERRGSFGMQPAQRHELRLTLPSGNQYELEGRSDQVRNLLNEVDRERMRASG